MSEHTRAVKPRMTLPCKPRPANEVLVSRALHRLKKCGCRMIGKHLFETSLGMQHEIYSIFGLACLLGDVQAWYALEVEEIGISQMPTEKTIVVKIEEEKGHADESDEAYEAANLVLPAISGIPAELG